MSQTDRYRTILSLGLPIIGGMLSQSVLNLVDAALVGRLGEASLAGVGIGSYANFVAISLILGLSSAVPILVARLRGAGNISQSASPVIWGLILSFLVAIPLSILFISHSSYITSQMSVNPAVQDIAAEYFDYRTAAMLAIGLNLSFRGWWNGSKRPLVHFKILIVTHLLNVIVSYCLIFGKFGLPTMGAPGAGLGTAIALYTGCIINLILVYRDTLKEQALSLGSKPFRTLSNLIGLMLPHSLQQVLFSLAICVLIWIIGQLGTQDQAIAHVLINLSLFLILPAVGFGVASTSLVSHAIGEEKFDDACQWGWDVTKTALVAMLILSTPLLFFPDMILSVFLHTDELIEHARLPLQLTALAICLDAAAIVLTQALLGAGANKSVLTVTTFGQWCFYLPLAWLFGPYLGFGLLGIWVVQVVHRSFSSLIFIKLWKQQKWQHIEI